MKKLVQVFAIATLIVGLSFQSYAGNEEDNKKTKVANASVSCNISGKILDHQSGEALVGVKVKIVGTDKITYTDFEGNFSCEGLNPGSYSIETNYISYENTTFKDINLSADRDQTLKMNIKPITE